MRKQLLLVLLAVVCASGLFAQCEDDRPLRIGVGPKVGLGLDMGSHSKVQNLDFGMGFGYQAGAVVNAHFGRRYDMSCGGTGWVGIQLEALYGSRAIKLGDASLRTNCLEIPVLAQVYVIPTLAIEAGATMVKVLSTSPAHLSHEGTIYNTGEIKGSDVMVSAGVVYKSPIDTNSSWMVDARFNLGMSPLAGNFDTKVSSIMVSFAYLFNVVK